MLRTTGYYKHGAEDVMILVSTHGAKFTGIIELRAVRIRREPLITMLPYIVGFATTSPRSLKPRGGLSMSMPANAIDDMV